MRRPIRDTVLTFSILSLLLTACIDRDESARFTGRIDIGVPRDATVCSEFVIPFTARDADGGRFIGFRAQASVSYTLNGLRAEEGVDFIGETELDFSQSDRATLEIPFEPLKAGDWLAIVILSQGENYESGFEVAHGGTEATLRIKGDQQVFAGIVFDLELNVKDACEEEQELVVTGLRRADCEVTGVEDGYRVDKVGACELSGTAAGGVGARMEVDVSPAPPIALELPATPFVGEPWDEIYVTLQGEGIAVDGRTEAPQLGLGCPDESEIPLATTATWNARAQAVFGPISFEEPLVRTCFHAKWAGQTVYSAPITQRYDRELEVELTELEGGLVAIGLSGGWTEEDAPFQAALQYCVVQGEETCADEAADWQPIRYCPSKGYRLENGDTINRFFGPGPYDGAAEKHYFCWNALADLSKVTEGGRSNTVVVKADMGVWGLKTSEEKMLNMGWHLREGEPLQISGGGRNDRDWHSLKPLSLDERHGLAAAYIYEDSSSSSGPVERGGLFTFSHEAGGAGQERHFHGFHPGSEGGKLWSLSYDSGGELQVFYYGDRTWYRFTESSDRPDQIYTLTTDVEPRRARIQRYRNIKVHAIYRGLWTLMNNMVAYNFGGSSNAWSNHDAGSFDMADMAVEYDEMSQTHRVWIVSGENQVAPTLWRWDDGWPPTGAVKWGALAVDIPKIIQIELVDWDGDGEEELFLLDETGGLWVIPNLTAMAGPISEGVLETIFIHGDVRAFSLGDLNRDGRTELVLGTEAGIVILAAPTPFDDVAHDDVVFEPFDAGVSLSEGIMDVVVTDVDIDGWPDLAYITESDELLVAYGQPIEAAEPLVEGLLPAIPAAGPGVLAQEAVDIDGDGWDDLVLLDGRNGQILLLQNLGAGHFADPMPLTSIRYSGGFGSLQVRQKMGAAGRETEVYYRLPWGAVRRLTLGAEVFNGADTDEAQTLSQEGWEDTPYGYFPPAEGDPSRTMGFLIENADRGLDLILVHADSPEDSVAEYEIPSEISGRLGRPSSIRVDHLPALGAVVLSTPAAICLYSWLTEEGACVDRNLQAELVAICDADTEPAIYVSSRSGQDAALIGLEWEGTQFKQLSHVTVAGSPVMPSDTDAILRLHEGSVYAESLADLGEVLEEDPAGWPLFRGLYSEDYPIRRGQWTGEGEGQWLIDGVIVSQPFADDPHWSFNSDPLTELLIEDLNGDGYSNIAALGGSHLYTDLLSAPIDLEDPRGKGLTSGLTQAGRAFYIRFPQNPGHVFRAIPLSGGGGDDFSSSLLPFIGYFSHSLSPDIYSERSASLEWEAASDGVVLRREPHDPRGRDTVLYSDQSKLLVAGTVCDAEDYTLVYGKYRPDYDAAEQFVFLTYAEEAGGSDRVTTIDQSSIASCVDLTGQGIGANLDGPLKHLSFFGMDVTGSGQESLFGLAYAESVDGVGRRFIAMHPNPREGRLQGLRYFSPPYSIEQVRVAPLRQGALPSLFILEDSDGDQHIYRHGQYPTRDR